MTKINKQKNLNPTASRPGHGGCEGSIKGVKGNAVERFYLAKPMNEIKTKIPLEVEYPSVYAENGRQYIAIGGYTEDGYDPYYDRVEV